MKYKITIKRKDGSLLIKEINDAKIVKGYVDTAKMYGDKVLKVEEKDYSGKWSPTKTIAGLVLTGATIGVGLGMLGAISKAFKTN